MNNTIKLSQHLQNKYLTTYDFLSENNKKISDRQYKIYYSRISQFKIFLFLIVNNIIEFYHNNSFFIFISIRFLTNLIPFIFTLVFMMNLSMRQDNDMPANLLTMYYNYDKNNIVKNFQTLQFHFENLKSFGMINSKKINNYSLEELKQLNKAINFKNYDVQKHIRIDEILNKLKLERELMQEIKNVHYINNNADMYANSAEEKKDEAFIGYYSNLLNTLMNCDQTLLVRLRKLSLEILNKEINISFKIAVREIIMILSENPENYITFLGHFRSSLRKDRENQKILNVILDKVDKINFHFEHHRERYVKTQHMRKAYDMAKVFGRVALDLMLGRPKFSEDLNIDLILINNIKSHGELNIQQLFLLTEILMKRSFTYSFIYNLIFNIFTLSNLLVYMYIKSISNAEIAELKTLSIPFILTIFTLSLTTSISNIILTSIIYIIFMIVDRQYFQINYKDSLNISQAIPNQQIDIGTISQDDKFMVKSYIKNNMNLFKNMGIIIVLVFLFLCLYNFSMCIIVVNYKYTNLSALYLLTSIYTEYSISKSSSLPGYTHTFKGYSLAIFQYLWNAINYLYNGDNVNTKYVWQVIALIWILSILFLIPIIVINLYFIPLACFDLIRSFFIYNHVPFFIVLILLVIMIVDMIIMYLYFRYKFSKEILSKLM